MSIGLKNSTSIPSLEMAMMAVLDNTCTKEYILELVAQQTDGKSLAEKINRTLRRMTVNNPILPYVVEHPQEFSLDLRTNSRPIIFTALMCSAYPIIYDTVFLLGKHFHAQDEVPTILINAKLSEKYGSSVDFSKAFSHTLKMLVDAGLIERKHVGSYSANHFPKVSTYAMTLYKQSFLLNNPNYGMADDVESNPYFEFVK